MLEPPAERPSPSPGSLPAPPQAKEPPPALAPLPSATALGLIPAFHYRAAVSQTLTPNDFPRLTSLIQATAPEAGSVREFGEGLLWEQSSGFSTLSLSINPEPPGTVIRADLRLDGRQGAYYIGSVAGAVFVFFGATTVLPLLPSIGIGGAALLAFGWLSRTLWNGSARRTMSQTRDLVERVAAAMRGDLT